MVMKITKDKWGNYKIMKGSGKLIPYLPETKLMKKTSFWSLINRYDKIILKPCVGASGRGVMQVSAKKNDLFEIHSETNKKTIKGRHQTFRYIKNKIKSRPFVIQRRIALATVDKTPFDVRVMVQKKNKGPWEVTGKLAKIAQEGYIITNAARGIVSVENAIKQSSLKKSPELSKIDKIAMLVAKRLNQFYKVRTIGFDIGIDKKGNIWVIEANFNPSVSPFLMLADKSMYRKIMSYKKDK